MSDTGFYIMMAGVLILSAMMLAMVVMPWGEGSQAQNKPAPPTRSQIMLDDDLYMQRLEWSLKASIQSVDEVA